MRARQIYLLAFILFFCKSIGYTQDNKESLRKTTEAAKRIEQKVANLPENEKKINKLILDKVNRMIEENAAMNYSGDEMVKRYSDAVARVDGSGWVKVKISLPDSTTRFEFEDLKKDLEKESVRILNTYFPDLNIKWYPEVTCLIFYQKIKEIAKDERISNITVSAEPVTYPGSVLTEGDSALFADVARTQHDVDGGRHHLVTVGVISDGIQGYDSSRASGDLPIFPWLSGHDEIEGREGRAMLEIVYDLAPGASLMFGSAGYGAANSTEMISTISGLIDFNCKVIVDDIGWPTDPWFLDGPLAQSIAFKIEEENITYVSAAGNEGKSMWTGLFSPDPEDWLDFYHQGTTANIQNRILVNNDEQVAVFLQWQDNWQDAENNYDLYVFDQYDPETPVGEGGQTVQGLGQNQPPLEVVTFTNTTGLQRYYNIQVKKVSGTAVYLKVDAYPKDLEYTHPSSQTHPSEQVVGHTAAVGVISVAAYPWYDDSIVEDFSVRGPTVLRDEWGYTETRNKPTITATDGVSTSVPGFIAFFGTSASAPHIAAIAALYYDKYGTLTSWENFYNDLINNADDIAGSTGGTWNYYAGYGKANALEALGGAGSGMVNVTVDQKNSTGASVDSIDYWDSDTGWAAYPVPKLFDWPENSLQILRAEQSLLSEEKFHDWSGNKYVNHDSFHVKTHITYIPAHLDGANNATIRNYFMSSGGVDPANDSLEFKDPWLIDYNHPPYGIRNRGISAPFKNRPSPFYPDYSTSYNGDVYFGVFLNQGLPNWQPPYYSVRVPQTQIIPFHGQNITWYFQGWEGNEVNFQHPDQTETAVVFHMADAEARAVYKGHLASNASTATAYNNSRKVAVDHIGGWHAVYEDNGQIYYTRSTNNGATWEAEEPVSGRFSQNRYPCITIEPVSPYRISVVWDMEDYDTHYFNWRTKPLSGSWEDESSSLESQYWWGISSPTKPAALRRGDLYILTRSIGVLELYRFNGSELEQVGVIPGTGETSENPTMTASPYYPSSVLYFAWEQRNQIYFSYFLPPNTFGEVEEVTLPSADIEINRQPSISYSYDTENPINVAWSGFDTDINAYVLLHRQRGSNLYSGQWGELNEVYYSYSNISYPSIGSFGETPYQGWLNVALKFNNDQIRVIQYNTQTWNWLPGLAGGHPSMNDQGDNLMLVGIDDTEGLPYPLTWKLFSFGDPEERILQKPYIANNIGNATAGETKRHFRKEIFHFSNLPGLNLRGKVDVSVGDLQIQTTDSSLVWPFTARTDTLRRKTFLQTEPLTVDADMQSIALHYRARVRNLQKPGAVPALPLFRLRLLDAASGQPLVSLRSVKLNELSGPQFFQEDSLLIDLQPYQGQELVLQMQTVNHLLSGQNRKPEQVNLYEFYPLASPQAKIFGATEPETFSAIPEEFALSQNYPNPFNPTTTIILSLPEDAPVILQVYDITGRKVRSLVSEQYPAGVHRVAWDGQNDDGAQVSSGVYIYRVQAGKFIQNRKMVLMR